MDIQAVDGPCGDDVAEGPEECDGTDDLSCPGMCLAPSITGKHPDHRVSAELVTDACFLSGLAKIEPEARLVLGAGINPAWAARIAELAPYISLWTKTNYAIARPDIRGVVLTQIRQVRDRRR